MSTPADLVVWLAADGLGLTAASNLFYGPLLETPDYQLCLRPYSGGPVETTLGGSGLINLSWPYIQAVARGVRDDYITPETLIAAVARSFTKIGDQDINGTRYHAVMAIAPPFPLRQDANFRWEHICNFRIMKDGL